MIDDACDVGSIDNIGVQLERIGAITTVFNDYLERWKGLKSDSLAWEVSRVTGSLEVLLCTVNDSLRACNEELEKTWKESKMVCK